MTDFHCELAWLGGETAERDVLVSIDGDRITAVEPGVTAAPNDATRLAGLTIPGLANAHSHAFHRALRGRTHTGPGSFWTWREQMYALAGKLDPDSYHRLARATFAEMALAGISVVGEFDAGRIAAGAYADLTTIGFDSVRTAGTGPGNAVAVAVFAATAADVRHVVISGRVVVADGRHTSIDVVGALSQALRA